MKYLGSKRKIAGEILPIMLAVASEKNLVNWVEPFVGGANSIKYVPPTMRRIGRDLNPHVIAALTAIRDFPHLLPNQVKEEEYRAMLKTPPDPITSWIRFQCAFGSLFETTFARDPKKGANYAKLGKNMAMVDHPRLQGVELTHGSYEDIEIPPNSLIYCDPPYANVTGYSGAGKFDSEKFYQWCRDIAARGNVVFVSEYSAPDDFVEVWKKEVGINVSSQRKTARKVTEHLYRVG